MEQIFTLLFYLFVLVAAINVAFYVVYFVFAFAKKRKATTTSRPPVSVIVCAKNEQDNLLKNIPKILEQKYDNFEVILINDASSDGTEEIMEAFESSNNNVQYVKVESNERFWGSKKYALTLGIKRASHKHLLFIDADCYPATNQWIQGMAAAFVHKKAIVLGYGKYERKGNSFLNKLIRFETVITAVQYFSYAMSGRPYMGVGRNLAYTSELFYEQKGFISHMATPSGDDDLFVNGAATSKNTAVQFSSETFTASEPKQNFTAWVTQKRRHITTAKEYKGLDKFLLGTFYASQLLFLMMSVVVLGTQWQWQWVVLIIAVRYLIAWIAIGGGAHKLKERDVVWLFPVLELLLVTIQLSIFIANIVSKPARWK